MKTLAKQSALTALVTVLLAGCNPSAPRDSNSTAAGFGDCASIEQGIPRVACYDAIARDMGLRVAELPSHYSTEALTSKAKDARPDCSALSQLLFGIQMGGPRSYLESLPNGLTLDMTRRMDGDMGRDSISGVTHGLPLRNAGVMWESDTVLRIVAGFSTDYQFELDIYLDYIESLINQDFIYGERSQTYSIGCENGVSIRVSKADIGGTRSRPPVYLLNLLFEYRDE